MSNLPTFFNISEIIVVYNVVQWIKNVLWYKYVFIENSLENSLGLENHVHNISASEIEFFVIKVVLLLFLFFKQTIKNWFDFWGFESFLEYIEFAWKYMSFIKIYKQF